MSTTTVTETAHVAHEPSPTEPAPTESPGRRLAVAFAGSKLALVGLGVLVLLVLAAVFAPWLAPQNPYDSSILDIMNGRLEPGAVTMDGATRFLLGSDPQGRDVLSAILYGLRISLLVGFGTTAIALVIGGTAGLLAAYVGGRVEAVIMRLVDLQLSFPASLIALMLVAVTGPGLGKVMFAIVAVQWAYHARTIRSAALVERQKEYIEAARSMGLSRMRIMFGHLLPNSLPPLMVVAALNIATAISLESTLSFLGVGTPLNEPSLGRLVANGYEYMLSGQYWMSVFPGVALVLIIVAINVIADRMREVMNPRLQK